jgi:hypothetical protein
LEQIDRGEKGRHSKGRKVQPWYLIAECGHGQMVGW